MLPLWTATGPQLTSAKVVTPPARTGVRPDRALVTSLAVVVAEGDGDEDVLPHASDGVLLAVLLPREDQRDHARGPADDPR